MRRVAEIDRYKSILKLDFKHEECFHLTIGKTSKLWFISIKIKYPEILVLYILRCFIIIE